MILFTSIYEPNNHQRESELIECIERNYNSNLFKRIVVLFEGNKGIIWRKINTFDIDIHYIDSRPEYNAFFKLINKDYLNETVIIANADIYFDNSIEKIKAIDLINKMIALTRYNKYGDIIGFQTPDIKTACADVWILKSPIKFECDYQLGIPHCDGKISINAYKAGMEVINLSRDIKTIHIHDKQYINKGRRDYKYKGQSLFVYIQSINETNIPEPDLRDD